MFVENAVRKLHSASASIVLFVAIFYGLALLFLSFLVGAAIVSDQNNRQVGYFLAINWSINFSIIFPFTLYFGLSAFQSVDRSIRRMEDRNMFVDSHWVPTAAHALADRWSKLVGRGIKWSIGFLVFGLTVSVVEWAVVSGYPLFMNDPGLTSEIDWSVSALFQQPASLVSRLGNVALGVLAFIYQGVAVGFVFSFIMFLLGLATLFVRHASHDCEPWLIPNIDSDDSRRGYEVFEELAENSFICCLLIYCFFYFGHLQNNYLQSQSGSLYDFVISDIIQGAISEDFLLSPDLFSVGVPNYSSAWAVFGAILITFVVMFFVVFVLRKAASESRKSMQYYLSTQSGPLIHLTSRTLDESRERIEKMQVWPISYLSLNRLLFVAAACLLCLVFYRIGLVLVGIAIATILLRAAGFTRRANGNS